MNLGSKADCRISREEWNICTSVQLGGDGPSGAQMATGRHREFGLVSRKPGALMGVTV